MPYGEMYLETITPTFKFTLHAGSYLLAEGVVESIREVVPGIMTRGWLDDPKDADASG